MNKRQTGNAGEDLAVSYLLQQGMRISDRNFRNRNGEIDIIGRHKGYLVFVEVKYRRRTDSGYAGEAVGYQKQKQICKVSDYYRLIHGIGDSAAIRFDVVAIQGEQIEWIQNAFPYIISGGYR